MERCLRLVCLCLALVLGAPVNIEATALGSNTYYHGTYYMIAATNNFIVVAIDSRITAIDPKTWATVGINDSFCKLRRLGDNAAFIGYGWSGASGFDPGDLLQQVYRDHPGGAVADVARDFASKAAGIYTNIFAKNGKGKLTDVIGEVYLIDFSEPRLMTIRIAFTFVDDEAVHYEINGYTGTYEAYGNGADEILQEALQKSSARAKSLFDRLKNKYNPTTPIEKTAVNAITVVTAVEEWSGREEVGGPVAAAIIERGKPFRWYDRPVFCPEK